MLQVLLPLLFGFFFYTSSLLPFISGELLEQKRLAQSSRPYYIFAYIYAKEGLLLLTEVSEVQFPVNEKVAQDVQLYNFIRDNNTKYKQYVRTHYKAQAPLIKQSANVIMSNWSKEKVQAEWEQKVRASKGKVIYVKEFTFDAAFQPPIEVNPAEIR